MNKTFTIIPLLGLAMAGCVPTPDFDSVPRIEYVGVSTRTETDDSGNKKELVTVTISFEDKEGDLGASTSEINDNNFKASYGESGNYELITVRKEADGTLTERIYGENRSKWFPLLQADDRKSPLKGKLDLNFSQYYTRNTVMVPQKYKIRIRDRALHYSNQIETDFVEVPDYP